MRKNGTFSHNKHIISSEFFIDLNFVPWATEDLPSLAVKEEKAKKVNKNKHKDCFA